ncbi:sulfatase-like hydrolase/transferase [Echinicola soli]|uniref:Sulfatase-like hydrolase/transferase n=1 Tax=Echinicola soli TaxID=2591634 RepID=A0A514CMM1_9BACT|nr:sulfatase-like hydrolase/transferase [Echinicola soli]QDH81051.1 sulfatase-like hydrolase/transferase [Echinicola soli]
MIPFKLFYTLSNVKSFPPAILWMLVLWMVPYYSYGQTSSSIEDKPNVIMIFIDDMGYGDLSAYGNCDITTPNMDRIGKEGVTLNRFYVGSPICSPSRITLMTGQYPSKFGITSFLASRERNEKRGMANYLDESVPTIADMFKAEGYATAHFGKWHMGGGRDVGEAPLPASYGFDESLVSFEGLGDRLLDKNDGLSKQSAELGRGKITWVEKHQKTPIYVDRTLEFIQKNKGEPFYINLWPNDVHDPFRPKEKHLGLFPNYANNHYLQEYLAVIYQLDQEIGRLLKGLEDMEELDNTLIILTSDNGPTDWSYYYKENYNPPGDAGPFRGRKWSLYEGGIRVPFMARWPGHITPGKVMESTVHATDLLPTLSNLLNLETPTVALDGENRSQVLQGKESGRSAPIYWEYGSRFDISPGNPRYRSPRLAIMEGEYKLLINDDSTHVELYDISKDIAETRNIADSHPEMVKEMSAKVLFWKRNLP